MAKCTLQTDIICKENRNSILLSMSSEYSSFLSVVFNMRHPIFVPFNLKSGLHNNQYKKLLLELYDNITYALENSIELISKTTTDIDWLRKKEHNKNYNFSVISIFEKAPNLFGELNNIILEFWKKGIEIGAIEKNLELPKISRNNFPWFW